MAYLIRNVSLTAGERLTVPIKLQGLNILLYFLPGYISFLIYKDNNGAISVCSEGTNGTSSTWKNRTWWVQPSLRNDVSSFVETRKGMMLTFFSFGGRSPSERAFSFSRIKIASLVTIVYYMKFIETFRLQIVTMCFTSKPRYIWYFKWWMLWVESIDMSEWNKWQSDGTWDNIGGGSKTNLMLVWGSQMIFISCPI